MATRRRGFAAFLAGLALFLAVPLAGPFAAEREDRGRPPGVEAFMQPEIQRGIRAGRERERARRERRGTADARARRRDSRAAYRGRNRGDALRVARERFGDVMTRPLWEPLRLLAGERVEQYRGDNMALVAREGEPAALAVSSLPLRAEESDGELAPVDLRLEDRGTAFVPANPLIEVRVDKNPARGVRFERAGFSVGLDVAGANQLPLLTEGPVLSEGRAFYPNVATDMDLVVQPMALGVETFLVLRSAESPEDAALTFELPPGAELRETPGDDRAVEVVREGRRIGFVEAPAASDAEGERVPVTYEIEGSRLRLRFPHRDGDYAYPLAVDPIIGDHTEEHFNILHDGTPTTGTTPGQVNDPFSGWGFYESRLNYFPHYVSANNANRGLIVYAYGGVTYNDNDYGEWYWQAPRSGSFIERADFGYVTTTDREGTCTIEGIYAPSRNNWDYGVWYENNGSSGSSPTLRSGEACSDLTNNYKAHCAGVDCNPNGTPGNMVVFGMLKFGTQQLTRYPTHRMEGATIWLYDIDVPVLTRAETSGNVPSGWTHSANFSTSVGATEPNNGLGIHRFRFRRNGQTFKELYIQCEGDRNASGYCPTSVTNVYSASTEAGADMLIPEGQSTFNVTAVDAVSKESEKSGEWTARVDRTPPNVDLSGSLAAFAGGSAPAGAYRLDATVTDQHSGLADVRLYIDGNVVPACGDGATSRTCGYTFDTNDHGLGTHTFKVVATDQLAASTAGHETVKEFAVTFTRPADFDDCMFEFDDERYCSMHNRDDQPVRPGPDPNSDSDVPPPTSTPDTDPTYFAPCTAYYGAGSTNCEDPDPPLFATAYNPLDTVDSEGGDTVVSRAAASRDSLIYGLADDASKGVLNGDGSCARAANGRAVYDGFLLDDRWPLLKVKRIRRIVPWNIMDDPRALCDFRAFSEEANRQNKEIIVAFGHRLDVPAAQQETELPSRTAYVDATTRFRKAFKRIHWMSAWNEPNHPDQPTSMANMSNGGSPERAALYTNLLSKSVCTRSSRARDDCRVIAGDFYGGGRFWRYQERYLDALNSARVPEVWAFHPYQDVREDTLFKAGRPLGDSGTAIFMRRAPSNARIWFTEVGSRVDSQRNGGRPRNNEASQANEVRFLIDDLAIYSARIERVYYYHWCEPGAADDPNLHDSGLINGAAPCRSQAQREAYRAYKARSNRNPDG